MAVFAPIPSASESTATTVKTGVLRKPRKAKRISWANSMRVILHRHEIVTKKPAGVKWNWSCVAPLMPLVPPYIESLRPYEAGRTIESVRKQYGLTRIAKLASNENPLGSSPKAIEAMTRVLGGLN